MTKNEPPTSVLIVEGADATGKTTFCREYAAAHNARYLHAEAPTTNDWIDEYVHPISFDRPIVCDRWHMGEIIWPTIFERRSLFATFDEYEHCTRMLLGLGASIIVVTRNHDDIVATLKERGEQDTIREVLAADEMFRALAADTSSARIPVIDIDDLRTEITNQLP